MLGHVAARVAPLLAFAACASDPSNAGADAQPTPTDFCGRCGGPTLSGTVANADVREASGIAASAVHEGVYYVHNDATDSPRFFAVSTHGEDLGRWLVSGANAVDWEDMARGPCGADGGSCLYFADTGDNLSMRTQYAIYRVREPETLSPGAHTIDAEAFPFTYPDGSHDSETLLVHPVTGAITVVTKVARGSSMAYEMPLPLTPDTPAVLVAQTALAPSTGSPSFTSGDVSPGADGVLLRTYSTLFHFPMTSGQRVGEALASTPCEAPAAVELQGEAVAWTRSGSGYVTITEGLSPRLSFVACGEP